jgi:MOSC domain-containing protein YiiM
VAKVLSVNLARVRANPDPKGEKALTGIDKMATDEAVEVRAPGPMHGGVGSGLVGDTIGNQRVHGGDDQAVYAYAREDLDAWEGRLERSLTNGMFGENLTTSDIEVTEARIGERWRIGSDGLLLEVSAPRIPMPDLLVVPADQGMGQDVRPGGCTRRIPAGDLARNGACR